MSVRGLKKTDFFDVKVGTDDFRIITVEKVKEDGVYLKRSVLVGAIAYLLDGLEGRLPEINDFDVKVMKSFSYEIYEEANQILKERSDSK